MDVLRQDLRNACRSLAATPLLTAAAIVSLTLACAANTAVFSLISALLLRPLPVHDPARLAKLGMPIPGSWRPHFSYETFEVIRQHRELFDGALAYPDCCGESVLAAKNDRRIVSRQYVSGDFLQTLGVRAWRGRLIDANDDRLDAAPVAMISWRQWRERFGARDDVLGALVAIDGVPFTIVGVLPPEYFGIEVGRSVDVTVPVRMAVRLSRIPVVPALNIVVRLKHGVSLPAATAALRAAQAEIRVRSLPKDLTVSQFLREPFTLDPFASGTSGLRARFADPLLAMFVVAVLVLFIACANVGNLLLARNAARRHELSVRVALGASPGRIVRQVLLESLALSAASAIAAALLASWAGRGIVAALSTQSAPIALDVRADWRLLAFTIALTGLSTMIFGLAPAWRARRIAPIEALNAQGRGVVQTRARLASGLIVGQVIVAVVLVVSASLLARTFAALLHAAPGLDAGSAVVVSVNAMTIPLADRAAVFERAASAVNDVPGIVAAAATLNPPLVGSLVGDLIVSAPGARPAADAEPISRFDTITPAFVTAYGMRIVDGRDFARSDVAGSQPVMMVNAAFARELFPGQRVVGLPLALHVRAAQGDVFWETRTIVGVVSNVAYRSPRDDAKPMIYAPMAQRAGTFPQTSCFLIVRGAGTVSAALMRQIDSAVKSVNPDLATTFEPVSRQLADSLSQERLVAVLSGGFGLLALLLASLGLYGVTAYFTNLRRREIGVRIALGATASDVIVFVIRQEVTLIAAGVIGGLLVSIWATRFIAALLYGVPPHDVATLLSAGGVLLAAGCFAAWLPARRAARLDPSIALRAD